MGHGGGDRCFVCMVHGGWTGVAWQPHATVGDSPVANLNVTRGVRQSLLVFSGGVDV